MKLISLQGDRDGGLAIVDATISHVLPVTDIAPTLQAALEHWAEVEPELQRRADELAARTAAGTVAYRPDEVLAPLPRAWQWLDGSAFASHGALMSIAFDMEPLPSDQPLMYQGQSDRFHAPTADVGFVDEAHDIDFEAEFGVIVSAVPRGTTVEQAGEYIRLVVIINDWSLRALAPGEMKRAFGFVQAKPASGMAPAAVTPDELGDAWRDHRVHLDMLVSRNGARFGAANGGAMQFGFDELVAHAARTRDLVAGTVIGSGTVSNETYREVGSSCITERRMIELVDTGASTTPFMHFGERVQMEARDGRGHSVFGRLDQQVVQG